MKLKEILKITYQIFSNWPKTKLLRAFQHLREKYIELENEKNRLKEEIEKLKKELITLKIKEVKKKINQPSSKQPEWEPKGVGNDGKGKKKGRGKKGRKGAGNRPKTIEPDKEITAKVETCDHCGNDLSKEKPLESTKERIIEDITEIPPEPVLTKVTQEQKYCKKCRKVTTARYDSAIPRADIGLNTTVLLSYLYVALCLPFTRISEYLKIYFGLQMTTAGFSKHLIRVSKILEPVYEEILQDIKLGAILYADETGWRINGKPWWLWVFGTHDSAYYTIDKSRGSDVVRRILGEIFLGVMVVDGWGAYTSIICAQQSCMAHLLRKIRKFRDKFPLLISVSRFYVKLRKILRDGEKLQADRVKIGEVVFWRRLKKLHNRLNNLLDWANPNDILKEIIKKVKRQQPRMLTFVENPGVPSHNNFAEYLIRIGILKRKISGGSKSPEGAGSYAILLSIHTTCKLRKISFVAFVKDSLTHYIKTGKPLLLREYVITANTNNHDLAKAA